MRRTRTRTIPGCQPPAVEENPRERRSTRCQNSRALPRSQTSPTTTRYNVRSAGNVPRWTGKGPATPGRVGSGSGSGSGSGREHYGCAPGATSELKLPLDRAHPPTIRPDPRRLLPIVDVRRGHRGRLVKRSHLSEPMITRAWSPLSRPGRAGSYPDTPHHCGPASDRCRDVTSFRGELRVSWAPERRTDRTSNGPSANPATYEPKGIAGSLTCSLGPQLLQPTGERVVAVLAGVRTGGCRWSHVTSTGPEAVPERPGQTRALRRRRARGCRVSGACTERTRRS